MDITFGDSDIVEQNEDILIHLFFNIIDYDFRNGFFSDESSIYDMGTCGFSEQDYEQLAQTYYDTCPENYTYTQGRKHYNQLSNEKFDNMVIEKFEKTYGFSIPPKLHYLKDFIILLKEHFPERNWAIDNTFILKTLNNRLEKEKKVLIENTQPKDDKIIKLPVRKKLSQEEIRNGLNEYLMVKELKMTWEEAHKLCLSNLDKKHEGKKFEPYIPEKT